MYTQKISETTIKAMTIAELKSFLKSSGVKPPSPARKLSLQEAALDTIRVAQDSEPTQPDIFKNERNVFEKVASIFKDTKPLKLQDIDGVVNEDKLRRKMLIDIQGRRGFLLGKDGSRVKQLQEAVGPKVQINIMEDGFLEFFGSHKSRDQITSEVRNVLQENTLTLHVPHGYAKLFLNDSLQTRFQSKYDVLISHDRRSDSVILTPPVGENYRKYDACIEEMQDIIMKTQRQKVRYANGRKQLLGELNVTMGGLGAIFGFDNDEIFVYSDDTDQIPKALEAAVNFFEPTVELLGFPVALCVKDIPKFRELVRERNVQTFATNDALCLYGDPEDCEAVAEVARSLRDEVLVLDMGLRGVTLAATSRFKEVAEETGVICAGSNSWKQIQIWSANPHKAQEAKVRMESHSKISSLCFNMPVDMTTGIQLLDQGRVRATSGALVSRKRKEASNNHLMVAGSPYQVHAAYDAVLDDLKNVVEIDCGDSVQFVVGKGRRVLERISKESECQRFSFEGGSTVAFRGSTESLAVATNFVRNVLDNVLELVIDEPLPFRIKCILATQLCQFVECPENPNLIRIWDGIITYEEANRRANFHKHLLSISEFNEYLKQKPHCWINAKSSKNHWDDLFQF